jgi:peptide/nickel transport system substrate-binding protein
MRRRDVLRLSSAAGVSLLLACTASTPAPVPSTPTPAASTPASVPKPAGPAPTAVPAQATPLAPTAAPAVAPTGPTRGGAISIGVSREAVELDVQIGSGSVRQYSRTLFNAITRVDLKGQVTGELVESWAQPDPTTYVFTLRRGITFHDGTPWNAQAFKYNVDRVRNPDTKSLFLSEYANVVATEVVDDRTLRITLKTADVTLPARLSGKAGHMLSPTALEKLGPDFGKSPVGSGPFEFGEWVKDDHLTVTRYAGYWEKDERGQPLPYLDSVTFKPIPDATVMFAAVRTGQLDLIEGILPSDLPRVQSESTLTTAEGPGSNQVVWLNNSKPPFDNKSLRQAVAWAINREAIHRAIYFGTGAPGTFFTPLEGWSFDPNGAFYTHDLARAKAALAAAGQPGGFKFTALADNSTVYLQLAQAVKGSLAEAGIDMSIEAVANATNTARRTSGDFEAAFSFLPPAADPDENIYNYVRTGASVNRGRYSNPKLDELLDQARVTADLTQRQKLYHEIQALVLDDSPILLIHRDADIKVLNKKLQGFTPSFDTFMRVEQVWIRP